MMELERPFDSDSFLSHDAGHPMVDQLFQQDSMETFKSSHERKPRLSKDALQSKLERENRQQQKGQAREKLHEEVKGRLRDEQRLHEDIQGQLHQARDAIQRRRTYADRAEQDIEKLGLKLASSTVKEDQLAVELAKVQVELEAFQSRMESIQKELQKARDMADEITSNRDKAKDEARQAREERREADEQKRLDAARREGMMQGKLEGMYAGWEDGKAEGYREGRRDGARAQYSDMRQKGWRTLEREFPGYEDLEERIPSPETSYQGDIPEHLRGLEAPIILPAAPAPKKTRRTAPPPITVRYDNRDDQTEIYQQPINSSPETVQVEVPTNPPSPLHDPRYRQISHREGHEDHDPFASRTAAERERSRPQKNVPPPRPVFDHDESTWEPPFARPQNLKRETTLRALGDKFRRKPEEIVPAPPNMDFAPIAASLPYPSVSTPLPHREISQPGRALPSPAPADMFGRHLDDYDDRGEYRRRARDEDDHHDLNDEYEDEEHAGKNKSSVFRRITKLMRGGPGQPPLDLTRYPITYQDVQSTPSEGILRSAPPSNYTTPAPSPPPEPQFVSAPIAAPPSAPPIWRPPPSPSHPPVHLLPDNYVPQIGAGGEINLPPPHELGGSAMQSAINLAIMGDSSRNPSRNPSPQASPRGRPKSAIPRSREPSQSPSRFSRMAGSMKHAASAVAHAVPSRSRSRSPNERRGAGVVDRQQARSRSRPRSTADVITDPYGLLVPENIQIGPTVSQDQIQLDPRGRTPYRKGTANSQMSGRSSPISQMSILSMGGNGALGLSRGGDSRDPGLVTYPNASPSNLSMIEEEERARRSNLGHSPTPGNRFQDTAGFPPQPAGSFHIRPPLQQRQYSDNSLVSRGEFGEPKAPWDPSSRYPPPPPSITSPPSLPIKSPRSNHPDHPWNRRPKPANLKFPDPLSPASSSRVGYAGIGAGGGTHQRAASTSVLGAPASFASPHPSARLSMAFSVANSENGPPPIAPKPPARRSRVINLDDPPAPGTSPYQNPGHAATRSWSGEQKQIGRTIPPKFHGNSVSNLGPVEERSPYLQGENARGSTASVATVHSNRFKFDPENYQDVSALIEPTLRTNVEETLGRPPPVDEKGPSKSVATKIGKRVTKVWNSAKRK
ncbi:hypothetical protein FRC18_001701 [Serendipita sp. 400]|nr:hypothetical protein FRC18_001701 [Serendipita sp. 400]